jgi:hypothetical protein
MAEVLTDQAAQLYYQRIMVRVGLFTDEQRQSGVDAYNTYIAALEKFKAKTLAPMRFNKHIWQRSNVNKAAFDTMMHQLNGKAHEFQDLIPKIAEAGMDTKKINLQTRNLIALLFPILDSERLVQNAHDITRSTEVIYQTFLIEFEKLPEEQKNSKAMK